ncbi:helix-turn-helix domain-containing protein [Burkholderia pseudomallei]|uniref:helix-turn-helix domain-containing protein n=1 Tax=Burkholderia TaxID=32008 RepID=UPI00100B71E6|nr:MULTISPECIES: helix-turn-helix domain-containing protein [Burkholderia]MCS6601675.1 helix-turn-helix domain-containing protein [Burkholderia pseudomallei]MCT7345870.1 helix-turn-helix domain-containing protein [Burkholderia pseudomallei]MCT7917869.1 helix-turn-helix domain-containing protein [Burkholderia pseudomallei]
MSINAMRIVWEKFPRGGSEMLVMLALADWCDDDGRSLYPSMNSIARKSRLSRSQTQRIVHRFVAEGFLEVVENSTGGDHKKTPHYWLRLDRLTGCTGATRRMGASRRADAVYGSHGCGVRVAPVRPNPSLTISSSNHQGDSPSASHRAPSSRRLPACPPCPVQAIVDAYHEAMPDNPRVKVVNAARKRTIAARWQEASRLACRPFDGGYETQTAGLAKWHEFFTICARSTFLTGHAPPQPGRPPFVADIDFLTSPSGFAHCLENKYHREMA